MANWYAKSFRKGTNAFAKYYNGSQWVKKPLKFYDGSNWTTRNGSPTDIRAQVITDSTTQTALGATKFWNGSAWQVVDALAQESYSIVARGTTDSTTITVTVGSKTGGGNAFYFNGYERRSITVKQGSTITFNTTNSTNNSHPFKLSTTPDGTHGSGSSYNTGVVYKINGQTVTESNYVSNYSNNGGGSGLRGIVWTVPNTSTTLYYYCTVHSGMGSGATITTSTTGEITSVDEGDSVYFHVTGREASETLYYEITNYLPTSNVKSVNFANDFSAPSSSSGTITTGSDKVGILQVTPSADNSSENTPENFQIEIYSDFNGSKGDLESFSDVITINDTSSAANPTTSGSYGTVNGNQYLGDSGIFGDTEGLDTGVTNFTYTFPTNTPLGHYYFVIWGGYYAYIGNSPATARDAASGSFNARITIGLLVTDDSSVVPQATAYNSTELGYTKNTVTHGYNNINRVQINNTTQGTSFDTTLIFPDSSTGGAETADRYFGLDTDSPDNVLQVIPGDTISITVRVTKTFGDDNRVRFNHNAF
jgi:hypothetical protein